MTDREFAIHHAHALLAEAARRRSSPVNASFYWWLIACAQNARREAAQMREPQRELFV